MKIRNKILIYFSTTVIALSAISLTIIYILFSEYREEEFQQQQKEKVKYTLRLLTEYKEMSESLANIMDKLSIHDFFDEKLMLFDDKKELIFSSIDDLPIDKQKEILQQLSPSKKWIETKEEFYDVIGLYTENNNKGFYAISKAYDAFGYSKMYFLKTVLIIIFISISIIVIIISLYLSNKISKPITFLADNLNKYDFSNENVSELITESSSFEIMHLTNRFNDLIKRTKEAFAFQKHTVNHISHQLKTPITILISELEKTKNYSDIEEIKSEIEKQINSAKSLGSIISVLLNISKVESGQELSKQVVRIDEIIFDLIDELYLIYPDFNFDINYLPDEIDENRLTLKINKMLIKQAFMNILINCINYSDKLNAEIAIDCSSDTELKITFSNSGPTVSKDEEKLLFEHFFRGENSQGKLGFGLGLVLTKKIITLVSGSITYSCPSENLNVFEIYLPLS